MTNKGTIQDADTEIDFAIRAGFEPEIFLFDRLSISTKFGLELFLMGDRVVGGNKVDDTGRTIFRTFGQNLSIVESLAFRWYF